MGPAHFGGGVSAESFGVDSFVGRFPFEAESFVPFRLAFGAGSAHVRSSEIARSVGVAAALPFGFVGYDSFSVPIDVCPVLGCRLRIALP
jgi:hypothetical protein